jgi:uncharacterized iron-regulated membrane protein
LADRTGARIRRALFQVHLWTGILAGLYVFLIFVTGAALVYRIDLQRALDPHLFTPRGPGVLAEPLTIMERVAAAYPQHRLSGVDAPTTSRPTYLAYVTRGEDFLTVLIDPVSAEILGELPERSLIRTLQRIHFDLLGGRTGRVINGVGAGCVLVLCLTGLVIWWPGAANLRRGFTVNFRRNWRRVLWETHRAVGIWTVLLTAMWAITGLYFVFPAETRSVVNWISPITVRRAPVSQAVGQPNEIGAAYWRAAIAQARRHAPDRHVARVVVPQGPRAAFVVLFADTAPTPAGPGHLTSVYLDQVTLERLPEAPLTRRSAGDVVMAWLSPLHVGNFGGEPIKILWLVMALAPPLLFASGFVLWWMRVVRRRQVSLVGASALD